MKEEVSLDDLDFERVWNFKYFHPSFNINRLLGKSSMVDEVVVDHSRNLVQVDNPRQRLQSY